MQKTVRIAVQVETNRAHGRALLEGIADYALTRSDWRLEAGARNAAVWTRTLATALLLLLATLPLLTSGFSPFIYNRF